MLGSFYGRDSPDRMTLDPTATATVGGSGRKSYVIITKTCNHFKKRTENYHKCRDELSKLQKMLLDLPVKTSDSEGSDPGTYMYI